MDSSWDYANSGDDQRFHLWLFLNVSFCVWGSRVTKVLNRRETLIRSCEEILTQLEELLRR